MRPENFPLLQSLARNGARFDEAVRIIAGALETGSIRNQVLQPVKQVLGSAVEGAWTRTVSEPFFYGGKFESQSKEVNELNGSIMIMGLHSVIATSKKLTRTKAQGPAVDAMRAIITEALPLAEAVNSLKPKVVMGREPAASKPVNPNKVVKTCPCCFRGIAVVSARMAHHGYERPGTGWQTASCPGIRFRPLEVSSEGLVWLISRLKDQRSLLNESIDDAPLKQTLSVRDAGQGFVEITRQSPRWTRVYRHYVAELETQVRMINADLPTLETRLRNWAPEVPTAAAALEPGDEPTVMGM
jgi:hypothetical protein